MAGAAAAGAGAIAAPRARGGVNYSQTAEEDLPAYSKFDTAASIARMAQHDRTLEDPTAGGEDEDEAVGDLEDDDDEVGAYQHGEKGFSILRDDKPEWSFQNVVDGPHHSPHSPPSAHLAANATTTSIAAVPTAFPTASFPTTPYHSLTTPNLNPNPNLHPSGKDPDADDASIRVASTESSDREDRMRDFDDEEEDGVGVGVGTPLLEARDVEGGEVMEILMGEEGEKEMWERGEGGEMGKGKGRGRGGGRGRLMGRGKWMSWLDF